METGSARYSPLLLAASCVGPVSCVAALSSATSEDFLEIDPDLRKNFLFNVYQIRDEAFLIPILEQRFNLCRSSLDSFDLVGATQYLFSFISQADPKTKDAYFLLLRIFIETLLTSLKKDRAIPANVQRLFCDVFDFFLNHRACDCPPRSIGQSVFYIQLFQKLMIQLGNLQLIELYNRVMLAWLTRADVGDPDSLREQAEYKIGSTHGMGGRVSLTAPCFVFFKSEKRKSTDLKDNLFLRHLSIYILDHFFREKGLYRERHIPYPLGENETGMYMEFVDGSEVSPDSLQGFWNANLLFHEFGVSIDSDLYKGWSEDGFPHNVISHYYSLDSVDFGQKQPDWFRIDFEPGSLNFQTEVFTRACLKRQSDLATSLSPTELKVLNMYVEILNDRNVDMSELQESVLQLRRELAKSCQREQVQAYQRHYLIGI